MDQLGHAIKGMITITDTELAGLLSRCYPQNFAKKQIMSSPGQVPGEIYFILEGIVRVVIVDAEGNEHTIHFALENQFIADYSAFMLKEKSMYRLEAIEATNTIIMPRAAIDWGYSNLTQGDKLGRLIAEFYFIYQDNRIKNLYARTPKERYDSIAEVFPNIHNRAPQHMIASYLGITPVHLSRLKKQ